MISYNRFWKYIKEHNVSQYRLIKEGISHSTMMRLKNNQTVNTDTLDKLCNILDCDIDEIIEHIRD